MILKLTLAVGNDDGSRKALVPLELAYFTAYPRTGSLVTIGTNAFQVKETIEEITQQIKEGGICGAN